MGQKTVVQPQRKPGEKEQEASNLDAEKDVDDQEYASHPDRHLLRRIYRRPRCVVEICENRFQ